MTRKPLPRPRIEFCHTISLQAAYCLSRLELAGATTGDSAVLSPAPAFLTNMCGLLFIEQTREFRTRLAATVWTQA